MNESGGQAVGLGGLPAGGEGAEAPLGEAKPLGDWHLEWETMAEWEAVKKTLSYHAKNAITLSQD
jgi:hypothetical protein